MKTFAVATDRFTRRVTLLVGGVIAGGILTLGLALLDPHTWETGIGGMLMAAWLALVAIPVVAFAFRPVKYTVTAEALLIVRPVGPVVLPLKDISGAMRMGIHDLGTCTRLFGSGGFFGYFGTYTSGRFGKMTWYATNRTNFVFVEMNNGKKYLITPEHPEALVKLLE